MKKFFTHYLPWVLLCLLIGYGLVMFGTQLAKPMEFELFNKGKIICFTEPKSTCYRLSTIELE